MSHHDTLTLFDYQEAILDKLRDGFIAGHRSQMLVAPTGAGKTEMAIELLEAAAFKGNRAAMVLDRKVLCNQTSARLDKFGIDHGVLMAKHWRYRPDRLIQVCSAQTLERRGSFPNLKLLIVDEAHETRALTVKFIQNNPGAKVVGLSATPFKKGLGRIYTNVVSAISTEELTRATETRPQRLVPLRVFIAKEIDMAGAKKVAGEWSSDEAEQRGIAITGDVVSEWAKKTHEVFGGPRKTVVFAAGVAHAADLAQKFSEAGYNFVSLSYKDDDDFKEQVIAEFSKPDSSIMGLIATDILTKGFDVPDVMIGVSARPFSKSLAQHVQQMGRVMRICPGKEFALWLDHSGNYLRFLEDWEDIFANGVSQIDEGKEKPRRERSSDEKGAAKCPRCGAFWTKNADACPHCGFVRPRRNEVTTLPGQMEELKGKKTTKPQDKELQQEFFSQLLHIANDRNYKPGWAAHKFNARFGVFPPRGIAYEPKPPKPAMWRWLAVQAQIERKKREAVPA